MEIWLMLKKFGHPIWDISTIFWFFQFFISQNQIFLSSTNDIHNEFT